MTTINPTHVPASFYDTANTLIAPQSTAESVAAGVQAKIENMPPAEREVFLQLLQASNLAPQQLDTPEELDAALGRLERAAEMIVAGATIISTSATLGSTASFLARAMIEFAAEQRKNALDQRMEAREQAQGLLKQQAGDMRQAADKMISGAVINLVMTVVMSVASAVMSGISMAGNMKAASQMSGKVGQMEKNAIELENLSKLSKNTTPGTNGNTVANNLFQAKSGSNNVLNTQFQTINADAQKFMSINQFGQAATQLGSATGNSGNQVLQAQGKEEEAQGSEASAAAQYAEGQADIHKDIQQQMNEFIKTLINFLKELREAEVDQMRAFTKI